MEGGHRMKLGDGSLVFIRCSSGRYPLNLTPSGDEKEGERRDHAGHIMLLHDQPMLIREARTVLMSLIGYLGRKIPPRDLKGATPSFQNGRAHTKKRKFRANDAGWLEGLVCSAVWAIVEIRRCKTHIRGQPLLLKVSPHSLDVFLRKFCGLRSGFWRASHAQWPWSRSTMRYLWL